MKQIDIGQAVGILANLGVIAGIVFLGIELRQNNELMAAQARFNQWSAQSESQTILAESPDLAGFLVRANNNEDLAPGDEARLEYYVRRVFTSMQFTFREVPEALLPVERWTKICAEPYRRKFWASNRDEFDADFVEFMEENVFGR